MNFKSTGLILQRLSKQTEKVEKFREIQVPTCYTQTDTQPVIWAKRQEGK